MSAPYPYRPQGFLERLRASALVLQLLWPLALVGAVFVAFLVAFALSDPAHGNGTADVAAPPAAYGGALAASAAATVASDPPGATVYVDGDSAGVTPLRLGGLGPGPHRLAVWLDGHARADTLVRLAAGEAAQVRLRLRAVALPAAPLPETPPAGTPGTAPAEAAPAAEPAVEGLEARVEVVVRPWGTVSIDGAVRRRDTDVMVSEAVEPGARTVRAAHPALGALEQTVRVAPGQTARLVFDLNAGTVSAGAP